VYSEVTANAHLKPVSERASGGYVMSMDYYAHGPNTVAILQKLAVLQPKILACMHGSAWRGDGSALLTRLALAIAD
jgi:hypothetical protein